MACVEVAEGNGRLPEWKIIKIQKDWKLDDFIAHSIESLGHPAGTTAKAFSVKLRLAPVFSVQMLKDGDKVLLCPDMNRPVPYGVLACGSNSYGQLGMVNSNEMLLIPEVIPTLSNLQIIQVACGSKHSIALTKQGQVFTFGETCNGRLGHGIQANERTIQPIPKLLELPECSRSCFIACGDDFSFIITRENLVYAFGRSGPWLGLQQCEEDVWTPELVQVPDACEFTSISCGNDHVLSIDKDGIVFSWGRSNHGKLGHVEMENGCFKFRTEEQMDRLFVDDKEKHVGVLIDRDCYRSLLDSASSSNELYTSKLGAVLNPVLISQLTESVIVGMQDGLTGDTLDMVKSRHGKTEWIFLLPDKSDTFLPRPVVLLDSCKLVAAGRDHSVMLTYSGRVFSCGANHEGQLGLGGEFMAATNFTTPVPIAIQDSLNCVTHIACGDSHTAAVSNDGTLFTWGNAEAVGREGDLFTPGIVYVDDSNPLCFVRDVACGDFHTVCCTSFGHALSFGRGEYGQLGDGGKLSKSTPTHLKPGTTSPGEQDRVFYSKGDGTKQILNAFVDPRFDENFVITSVAAGGGAFPMTAHSLLLVGSQIKDLKRETNQADNRNMCVAFAGAPDSDSCGIL